MLLSSGEAHLNAEAMATEAARLYAEEACGPFPYEGCRWLRGEFEAPEELVITLDLWLMRLAGYCSWGKRILSWSAAEVSEARGVVSLSFFEEHPEYAWLERHITEENTPDLRGTLLDYERVREALLEVFDYMLLERYKEVAS